MSSAPSRVVRRQPGDSSKKQAPPPVVTPPQTVKAASVDDAAPTTTEAVVPAQDVSLSESAAAVQSAAGDATAAVSTSILGAVGRLFGRAKKSSDQAAKSVADAQTKAVKSVADAQSKAVGQAKASQDTVAKAAKKRRQQAVDAAAAAKQAAKEALEAAEKQAAEAKKTAEEAAKKAADDAKAAADAAAKQAADLRAALDAAAKKATDDATAAAAAAAKKTADDVKAAADATSKQLAAPVAAVPEDTTATTATKEDAGDQKIVAAGVRPGGPAKADGGVAPAVVDPPIEPEALAGTAAFLIESPEFKQAVCEAAGPATQKMGMTANDLKTVVDHVVSGVDYVSEYVWIPLLEAVLVQTVKRRSSNHSRVIIQSIAAEVFDALIQVAYREEQKPIPAALRHITQRGQTLGILLCLLVKEDGHLTTQRKFMDLKAYQKKLADRVLSDDILARRLAASPASPSTAATAGGGTNVSSVASATSATIRS